MRPRSRPPRWDCRKCNRVFVPHPIQDATDDEMRDKADAIIDQLVAALKK